MGMQYKEGHYKSHYVFVIHGDRYDSDGDYDNDEYDGGNYDDDYGDYDYKFYYALVIH